MSIPNTFTVEQLEEMLRTARKVEADAKKRLAESVEPIYQFTFLPKSQPGTFDRIYDDTVVEFTLTGTILNMDEIKAVGGDTSPHGRYTTGSMDYLVSLVSNSIIMRHGGGTVWISNPWSGDDKHDYEFDCITEMNSWLHENPQGGDCTEIIVAHQRAKGRTFR